MLLSPTEKYDVPFMDVESEHIHCSSHINRIYANSFLLGKFGAEKHLFSLFNESLFYYVDHNNINKKLESLLFNSDGKPTETFRLSLCHLNGNKKLVNNSYVSACLQLFKSVFNDKSDQNAIDESVLCSSLLFVYGNNDGNKLEIIAAISFVLFDEGIYINWLDTSGAKYNRASWTHGDNKPCQKHGLGYLMLHILWQIEIA